MIPRTVYLGEEVAALASFFKNGQVIEVIDSSIYPFYTVRDTEQKFVTGGVGTLGVDNLYHATFTIPSDAAISTPEAKYVIEWEMLSITGETYILSEYFDVIHADYNEIIQKEQQNISLSFTPLKLVLPVPSEVAEVTFVVYDELSNIVYTGTVVEASKYSNLFIYETTIPADTLTSGKIYSGVWTFRVQEEISVYLRKITVCDLYSLNKVSDIRMYLDKVGKSIDLYTGYRDSDLIFHLNQAVSLLNLISPITEWRLLDFTTTLKAAEYVLIQAACYSALKSQYLAEGDNAFDFSGQPVTLTVDRTQYIESELSRIQEYLENVFPLWKKQFKNRQHSSALGLTWPSVNRNFGIDQRRLGIPLIQPIRR